MAIANVGTQVFSDTSGSNATTLVSSAFNLPAGHLVTVAIKWETSTAVTSVTDTAGNTYTACTPADDTTQGQHAQIFYCLSSTANAANVVTVTWPFNSAQYLTATVKWSSYSGSVALTAQTQTIGGSGTAVTTASFTAGGYAVAAISDFAGATTTPGSGWTEDADVSAVGGHALSRYDTPGGSYVADATLSTGAFWAIAAASFSEAGGGGPTIDVQPTNQRVPAGDAAAFSVTATTSGGTLTYQWQSNVSGSFVDIGGATSSTYGPAITAGQAYAVRVVVTDSNGSATSNPADAWAPAVEPHPWQGHYSKGNRSFARANLLIPNGGVNGQIFDDAIWGAPPGAVTHASSGSLVAGSAAVAGTATQSTPEAPALQSAQPIPAAWYADPGYAAAYFPHRYGIEVSNRGDAAVTHTSSGDLTAGSAQVAGSAVRTLPHATSGALAAGAAQVSGSAVRTLPHSTSGALTAGSATIAGTAAQTRAHASSGALVTGSAVVAGSAVRTLPHATSGALVAGSATVAGTADHVVAGGTHDTSGALVAGSAQVAGSAVLNLLHTTSGALVASAAAVSGTAAQTRAHASSGALAAGSATVSGTAAQTREHASSGSLTAGAAVVAGASVRAAGGVHATSGALVAGAAQVSGAMVGPDSSASGGSLSIAEAFQIRKQRQDTARAKKIAEEMRIAQESAQKESEALAKQQAEQRAEKTRKATREQQKSDRVTAQIKALLDEQDALKLALTNAEAQNDQEDEEILLILMLAS